MNKKAKSKAAAAAAAAEKLKLKKKRLETERWKTPPRAFYNVPLNLLGLQVFRTILFKMKWVVRRYLLGLQKEATEYSATLKQDGIVVIPNFLEEDLYARLKDYYYKAISEQPRPDTLGPKVVAPVVCSPRRKMEVPVEIVQAFIENQMLNKTIEASSGHTQNVQPLIRLHHYFTLPEDIGTREAARTDELHYDVPLDNMRAFFYMEACDRHTAAFEYAKNTHKFSLKRLIVEYFDSLVQSKARAGKPDVKVQPIRDWMVNMLKVKTEALEAPGNTLIIFNTMGLHRRGVFTDAGTREAILLDYRFLDTKANSEGYPPLVRLVAN